jgi:hypothetical protein
MLFTDVTFKAVKGDPIILDVTWRLWLTYTKMLMFIECRPKHGTHDDIDYLQKARH